MKVYEVEIGGKVRPLRYTSKAGVALFKRFGRPLTRLFLEDCLGLRDKVWTGDVNPEAQIAVLATGLRVDEDKVCDWLDGLLKAGKPIADLLGPAIKAAFYSGIVNGKSLDLDEVTKDAEDEAGKAETSPEDSE